MGDLRRGGADSVVGGGLVGEILLVDGPGEGERADERAEDELSLIGIACWGELDER